MVIRWDRWRLAAGLLLLICSLWILERARTGVDIENIMVGQTPVTVMQGEGDGPAVVVAHGFAGSRQMMQGYSLLLAQAGYRVFAFDFEGHGRHRVPMSGDVNAIDGTTRLLMNQTQQVIETARADDAPVALLGHSMATDILIRVANETENIGPLVLLSAFSQAVDESAPRDLLFVTGAWEPGLREFALESAASARPEARRDVLIAPIVEHVSILHSRAGRKAAVDWVNTYYDRDLTPAPGQTGWALIGVLAAITLLFSQVARFAPASAPPQTPVSGRVALMASALGALATPPLAWLVTVDFLDVLVADYLMVHLAIYGMLQLAFLMWARVRLAPLDLRASCLLLVWTLFVFGFALDRYGASFWPTPERWQIIAILAIGAVPFMLADARLTVGAGLMHRVLVRTAFLASLGFAVALNFSELSFLFMIAPVVVLFFLSFGYMGRISAARSGATSAGVALGLALAWAIGVSFPLFAA